MMSDTYYSALSMRYVMISCSLSCSEKLRPLGILLHDIQSSYKEKYVSYTVKLYITITTTYRVWYCNGGTIQIASSFNGYTHIYINAQSNFK